MPDKRVRPKLAPPRGSVGGQALAHLDHEDYRKFYELVMESGTSASEFIREMIRDKYRELYG